MLLRRVSARVSAFSSFLLSFLPRFSHFTTLFPFPPLLWEKIWKKIKKKGSWQFTWGSVVLIDGIILILASICMLMHRALQITFCSVLDESLDYCRHHRSFIIIINVVLAVVIIFMCQALFLCSKIFAPPFRFTEKIAMCKRS